MTDDEAAAIDAAEAADEESRESGLCPLAVCRGLIRTVRLPEPDGDVQPYGYCTSCGLPVS